MVADNRKKHRPVDFIKTKEDEIIERMKTEGLTLVEVASFLDIDKHTLSMWIKRYPEIASIMRLGLTHSEAWWCKKGRDGIMGSNFNFSPWSYIMNNCFGWGASPTERALPLHEWHGTFEEKIQNLDKKLETGEISTAVYEKMMRSLGHHAIVNEIIYVQPTIQRMEAETKYKDGTLTKEEYELEIAALDKMEKMRQTAADLVFKESDLYSRFPKTVKNFTPKPKKPHLSARQSILESPTKMRGKLKKMDKAAQTLREAKRKARQEKMQQRVNKLSQKL